MKKMIYNLEKTTGGKDSYKNYPAFAFCIEMNHDPENKLLPPPEFLFRLYLYIIYERTLRGDWKKMPVLGSESFSMTGKV